MATKLQITVTLICKRGNVSDQFIVHNQMGISDLKQEIRDRFKEQLENYNVKLIYAGCELKDDNKVENANLYNQTVLHAVAIPDTDNHSRSGTTSYNMVKSQQTSDNPSHKSLSYYYVYCKHSECRDICEAKLRVKCSSCNSQAIQLMREPQCWSDVLEKQVIKATCLSQQCDPSYSVFYFKCCRQVDDDHCAVILRHITCNITTALPCLACFEVRNPVVSFVNTDGDACSHVLCIECFKLYATHLLTSRQFAYHEQYGYTIQCPDKCEGSYITDCHHFRILGDELYERYHRYGTEECLIHEGGLLCPQVGCGEGIFPPPPEQPRSDTLHCLLGCQSTFCRRCLSSHAESGDECPGEPHGHSEGHTDAPPAAAARCDSSAQQDPSGHSLRHWQKLESHRFIKQHAKNCPQCHTPTVRDGGCMHMTCVRVSCKYEWCWLCEQEWSRDCQGNHWFG